MIAVKFTKLFPDAKPFVYTRPEDVCMDMYSYGQHTIDPHCCKIIPTGIAVEIPDGYEGLIRGRSGLNSKGILVQLGTIESTYRGDVGIVVYNSNPKAFIVEPFMRLAQFTIKPVVRISLEEATTLSQTERGTQGYGSSGYK